MNRNYPRPSVSVHWANTHMAVAVAIHAIADNHRTAEAIWAAPTAAEVDHVTMAVEEYITHGDYEASEDGRYAWGDDCVRIIENMTVIQFVPEDDDDDDDQVVTAKYSDVIVSTTPELEMAEMWTVNTNNEIPRYDSEPGEGSVSFRKRSELIAFMRRFSLVPAYLAD